MDTKTIWKKIVEAELEYNKISYLNKQIIPIEFADKIIRNYQMRDLVIDEKVILMIIALQKNISQINIATMQSHLKQLNLSAGIIVNFGKEVVQISGVRKPH